MVSEFGAVEFLLNDSEVLLRENAPERAFDLLQQALQLARQSYDLNRELKVLQSLAKAYQQTEQTESAIATLEQAAAIAIATVDLYSLYQCHRHLAYAYKAINNFESAFHSLEAAEVAREEAFQAQSHPWFQLASRPLGLAAPAFKDALPKDDPLNTTQEHFHSLFNSIPIGLYRARPDGALLEANPALLQLLGFPDWETFICTPGADHYMRSVVQQTKQCALDADGVLRNCEVHLRRYDGRLIWVRFHTRLVYQKGGTPLYYEGAMEDISETKVAQEMLEELATLDSLTHIFNRRHFLDLAQRELARAVRFQRPLALIMLDIDHFKAVNDAYGHLTGDDVLREVVFRLQTNLRRSDILARFGGEEFILLMPETTEQEALEGAERLRCIVADSPYEGVQSRIALTISLGLTSWCATQSVPPYLDDLIYQADQALYQAKRQGRNQTQIHRPSEAEHLRLE
ncbi:MAG TPA: diguanylate cyclase [Leptolyngbyaceae cyanobacterium]